MPWQRVKRKDWRAVAGIVLLPILCVFVMALIGLLLEH